jgi:hypothetical protein
MTTRTMKRIAGRLSMKDGRARNVQLDVETVELRGDHGVEDEAVARVDLATPEVPDGEYILDYFCFKPYSQRARVRNGELTGLD